MERIDPMNLVQIRQKGVEALIHQLGPAGMIRFLQQFEPGQGDYSKDRHQLLGKQTVTELITKIHQRRNTQE
mgnify:CR=1 FL=1